MRRPLFDIAFMGTSLTCRQTSGYWLDDFGTLLRKQVARPIRVYDFGVSGAKSADGLALVASVVRMRPRCVVIEYTMNDAVTVNNVSVATMKANLTSIATSIASGSPGTRIALMTMNPAISTGATEVPNLATYYQGVRDVAAALGAGLIDNTPLWGTPTASQIPGSGVHPTRDAVLAIAVPNMLSAILPFTA